MKLDPKYFNLFIFICAFLTVIVIVYGTMNYHSKQERTLQDNIENTEFGDISFLRVPGSDTLRISDFRDEPVLIDFWATWSGKSQAMHQIINQIQQTYPELKVIAASVRDDEEMVNDYVENQNYSFIYVSGTDLYYELQVPGVPSHILIDREGKFFDFQVGEHEGELERKVKSLMQEYSP
jgi:thiol-disulfide isomerase/thioredoxin